ncbi:hypothetical protein [Sporosarcina sp. 6E9]|uniref:hypothetical protein n=1 Tax=Sporosarcina sp. 6E9 TaxID=2819235 RepID=UPI001B314106|nr:hypothetical protein [Sporosarcina sp. 6E9]
MLFVYSFLGFFMIYFTIFAIRAIIDEKHKHYFMIYTILASICGGGALFFVLLGALG